MQTAVNCSVPVEEQKPLVKPHPGRQKFSRFELGVGVWKSHSAIAAVVARRRHSHRRLASPPTTANRISRDSDRNYGNRPYVLAADVQGYILAASKPHSEMPSSHIARTSLCTRPFSLPSAHGNPNQLELARRSSAILHIAGELQKLHPAWGKKNQETPQPPLSNLALRCPYRAPRRRRKGVHRRFRHLKTPPASSCARVPSQPCTPHPFPATIRLKPVSQVCAASRAALLPTLLQSRAFSIYPHSHPQQQQAAHPRAARCAASRCIASI
jgi:hypothetical protein